MIVSLGDTLSYFVLTNVTLSANYRSLACPWTNQKFSVEWSGVGGMGGV